MTWKVSDADRALVKKSSSFCIANLPDVWSPSSPSTAATKCVSRLPDSYGDEHFLSLQCSYNSL